MPKFIGRILLEPLPDGKHWRLVNEIWFETRWKTLIRVQPATVTDFASVPRLFWNILPPWDRYGAAAIVHDYLYKTTGDGGIFSRKQSDVVFLDGMTVRNVKKWKKYTMYAAVRLFGWVVWNKYKKGGAAHA